MSDFVNEIIPKILVILNYFKKIMKKFRMSFINEIEIAF